MIIQLWICTMLLMEEKTVAIESQSSSLSMSLLPSPLLKCNEVSKVHKICLEKYNFGLLIIHIIQQPRFATMLIYYMRFSFLEKVIFELIKLVFKRFMKIIRLVNILDNQCVPRWQLSKTLTFLKSFQTWSWPFSTCLSPI